MSHKRQRDPHQNQYVCALPVGWGRGVIIYTVDLGLESTQLAFFINLSGPLSARQLSWRADNGPL